MWVAVAFIGHGFYLTYYSRRYCGPSSGYLRVLGLFWLAYLLVIWLLLGYCYVLWLTHLAKLLVWKDTSLLIFPWFGPVGILLEGAFLS